jgi:hypothetical protein
VRATLVLLLTTLAFVASLFVLPGAGPSAHAKKGDTAIGAAHVAMVHVAKPVMRKAERIQRTDAPAIAARVFAVARAAFALAPVKTLPRQHPFSVPDRSLLMVFLN